MTHKKAFTLIELSIVIVIIGLIVAGVVGGQQLVQQSQLRGVITKIQSIKTAFNTFRLTYDAIPGDMANAHSYWPGCNSGANEDDCNGDGNKKMANGNHGVNNVEGIRAWQHLNLAGILPNSYTGVASTGHQHDIGVNCPEAGINNAGFYVRTGGEAVHEGNWLAIGKFVSGERNYAAALTPSQTYNIDLKIDDGRPRSGKFINSSAASCSDDADNYNLDNADISCRPLTPAW